MVLKILRRYTLLSLLLVSISFGLFKQIKTAGVSYEDAMRGAMSPDTMVLPEKEDDRRFIRQYRAAPRLLTAHE